MLLRSPSLLQTELRSPKTHVLQPYSLKVTECGDTAVKEVIQVK